MGTVLSEDEACGAIITLLIFSILSCVVTSKVRTLSTSSPNRSILIGSGQEYEKMSIILPRTAYSPGA